MATKPKYGSAEYLIEEAEKSLQKLKEEVKTIRKSFGKVNALNKMPNLGKSLINHFHVSFGSWNRSFDKENRSHVENALANAKKIIEEHLKELDLVHKKNEPLIEENKKTRACIYDFMKTMGFPEQYTVYELPTPRHRKKQRIAKNSGFVEDCRRLIQVEDGYESLVRTTKRTLSKVESQASEYLREISKAEKQKELEEKKKEEIQELARFQVKYDTKGEWEDVLKQILEKDKYLVLAHYLLKNRENWNEGYHYAKIGLNRFEEESPEEIEIAKEIRNIIEDENSYPCDGRVFRDCKYNYSKLFAKVDKALFEDYETVKGKLSHGY